MMAAAAKTAAGDNDYKCMSYGLMEIDIAFKNNKKEMKHSQYIDNVQYISTIVPKMWICVHWLPEKRHPTWSWRQRRELHSQHMWCKSPHLQAPASGPDNINNTHQHHKTLEASYLCKEGKTKHAKPFRERSRCLQP